MDKFKNILILVAGITLVMASCSTDEIDTYNPGDSGLYFTNELDDYSFYYMPDQPSMEVSLPVTMIGPAVSYDRTFGATIEKDTTTAPSNLYEILGGTVKANELTGTLKLKLYNADDLADTTYVVGLRIAPGNEFTEGFPTKMTTIVRWNSTLPRPVWFYNYSYGRYLTYTIDSENKKHYAVYSTKLCEVMLNAWGTLDINFFGAMGRTEEILAEYPIVSPGTPLFAMYMHKLETYIYEYNQANPGSPLRHSDDAIEFSQRTGILPVTDNPLILVNPYGV